MTRLVTTVGTIASLLLLTAAPLPAGVVDTVVDTTPTGATVDATVNVGEYVGTVSGGGSGFGGPVGNGTLSVDSDLGGINFGFSGMGDISGNSIRVYFDTVPGGHPTLSDGAGFNDFGDFGRERVSRPATQGLTLPFEADYGWIISPAFGGFQANFFLQPGGNGSLGFAGNGVVADPIGEFPSNPTYEFYIPHSELQTGPGSVVDFVVVYGNNNDQDNADMSDEGFPFQIAGGNPLGGPVVLTDFHRLVTAVPEPSTFTLALLATVAFGVKFRRRR